MWKLGNRATIVLVCVLSGCVILCNIWGLVFGIIIALLLVIYASVFFLPNDKSQTPHALLLLEYIASTGREFYNLLRNLSCKTSTCTINLIKIAKTFYQNYIIVRMDRRRGNTYQLSTDTFSNSSRNSELNMAGSLTPIGKNRRCSYISGSENNSSSDPMNAHEFDGGRLLNKVTSTPLIQWKKRESHNGDMTHQNEDIAGHKTALKRRSSLYLHDHTVSREDETVYSPRGSPWGTSISPKMRPRAAGIKTVQTVAGPLLTSTRYNIDPKVYTDVTSPGLTSRLSKYATEANTKLIHQSQYGTGQFPKVNLNVSPTPIINSRSTRARNSVIVRVAPPETIKYSSPERKKISWSTKKNRTPSSVEQVLKEISLKRHASRDDITAELAKKQRTDGILDDKLENYEEITQKRGRDDSSKTESDTSFDSTLLRPSKRTKMPSCYDILNSLSSSTNVSSGVKRKADISRSGTPDIGKHFKSLDNILRSRSISISPQQNHIKKSLSESLDHKSDDNVFSKISQSVSPKIISPYNQNQKKILVENERKVNDNNSSTKLTDRLFMRAEPQNIDKLKSLIEEHGNVTSKFTGDDGDEIKKSDVVIMRQTSMKARLQSMFDAISGKISGQIDPNVVIQAEQVNNPTATTASSSSTLLTNQQSSLALTTLNSSTSTTSINTSPISTSAIVPIIGKTKTNTTPGKHVTFMLPTAPISMTSNITISSTATEPAMSLSSSTSQSNTDQSKNSEIKDNKKSLPSLFNVSSTTNSTSLPVFSSPLSSNATLITPTAPTNLTSNLSSPIVSSTLSNVSQPLTLSTISSPSVIKFDIPQSTSQEKIQLNAPSTFTISSTTPVASTTPTTSCTVAAVTTVTSNFSFGTPTVISTTATNLQTTSTVVTQSKPLLSFQSIAPLSSTSTIPTLSTNLFAATKPTPSTLFSDNTNATSSTTPTFSFGQFPNNTLSIPSTTNTLSIPSTTNTLSQGGFAFGTTINSTVNANTTTTQSQESTKSQITTIMTPSTFTFGNNNIDTNTPAFGLNTPNVNKNISTSTFSTDNSNTINATSNNTPVTTSSSMFGFGGMPTSTKPLFSFTALNNSQTTTENNSSMFGVPSQPPASSFNNNTSSTNVKNPLIFGTNLATTSQSNTTTSGSSTLSFAFGTTTVQQSTFPSTTLSTPNANGSTPQFGGELTSTLKPTEPPVFGMNSTIVNSTANMSNNLNTAVVTTASTSLFDTTNNSNSFFGQSKIAPPIVAFGASSSTSSNFTTKNPTNIFGTTGQSLSFGVPTPTTTASFANSTSTFGTTNIPTSVTSAPPLTPFGASSSLSTSSSFGALKSISPNFGSASTGNFLGAQNQNSTTTFNTTTSTFASGATLTTTTAAAAPLAFGTTSTSTFGTPSAFGIANAPPPAFDNSVNKSTFSDMFSTINPTNSVSPFGNQSSTAPTFGNTNPSGQSFSIPSSNNVGSVGGTFTFGTTPTNQSQQQNPPFAFRGVNTNNNNSNNNNNNSSSNNNGSGNNMAMPATPFQFNATTPQPGGFNFTGGSATPTFGGSTAGGSSSSGGGGMFSIGSGTTTPRSKLTRPRRQQR